MMGLTDYEYRPSCGSIYAALVMAEDGVTDIGVNCESCGTYTEWEGVS